MYKILRVIKRILTKLFNILLLPFRFLRKTSADNFALGLMFGAIFSLVVNIATVKIQEDINRQRTLEALEREIVDHHLMVNNIVRDRDAVYTFSVDEYAYPSTMSFRFNTSVYDSDQVKAYLFEINPQTAAKIESYYSYLVEGSNVNLDRNEKAYNLLGGERCQPVFDIIYGVEKESAAFCNELSVKILTANIGYADSIYTNVEEIRKTFHPTQDRLDNWWLKLLLGDKAYEVMKLRE